MTLLTEPDQTTKSALDDAFDRHLQAADRQPDDLVIIYLSCHGQLYNHDDTDPYRGKGSHLVMRLLVPTAQAPLSSSQEPCPYLFPIGGLLVYSLLEIERSEKSKDRTFVFF